MIACRSFIPAVTRDRLTLSSRWSLAGGGRAACDGPRAATYESILCRLDQLIALVRESNDLGKTKTSLEKLSVKARERTATSQGLVTGGKRKAIKNTLHKGSRKMVSFNFRVRSLVGRRLIGGATAAALRELGEPLVEDMRALLKTL